MRNYIILFVLISAGYSSKAQNPSCNVILSECDNVLSQFAEEFFDSNCSLMWEGECSPDDPIFRTGSVSIGAVNTNDKSLSVQGGIFTVKLKICTSSPWCDYVFDPDYKLLSFTDLKNYIKKNGHLPSLGENDIIDQNGKADIETIVYRQQEKIEEIYLYLFDLEARIQKLKK